MKKIYNALAFSAFAIMMVTVNSCKKKDDTSNNNIIVNNSTFTPANITPTQPGHIQLSTCVLTLHAGDVAQVTAKLFESNGTLSTSQPAFVWTSDNSSVANVSGGTISAQALGVAEITVTDGSHGLEYVIVNVVPASQTIGSGAASISFNPPTLVLNPGQTGSFTYTLYNKKGQSVSGSASAFYCDKAGDATATGNTVTAGTNGGVYKIAALVGNDTISGFLNVIISGGGSQTTYTIDNVYYPNIFGSKELTAKPVRITVTEKTTDNNGAITSLKEYQTSPDQISSEHPDVVTGNGGGLLKSIHPGYAKLKVTYKDVSVEGWSIVRYELKGDWTRTDGSGNVSFSGPDPQKINYYHRYVYSFSYQPVTVTYHFNCDNSPSPHDATYGYVGFEGFNTAENPMGFIWTPIGWDATNGKILPDYYFGQFYLSSCPVSGPVDIKFVSLDEIKLVSGNGSSYSLVRVLQNTYAQFDASTTKNGGCKLDYKNTTVLGFISDDNIKNDSIFLNGRYFQQGDSCFTYDDSFEVHIPISLNSQNKWAGSVDYDPFSTVFHFKLENGDFNATKTEFSGTIIVESDDWNTITKNIILKR